MERILGIDPGGVSGGWAVLDEFGKIISTGELPVAGTGAQRVISGQLFAAVVERFTPARACIERVGPMPKQGTASTFKFGRGLGVVEGVIGGAMIPVDYVSPAVWKRHFGLGADKEQSRQKAIETWPESAALHFARVKDHGRAEASLIALWAARAKAVTS